MQEKCKIFANGLFCVVFFLFVLHRNIFKKGVKHGPFMEFQYCEKFLPIKKLFKFKNIRYWAENSLYVEIGAYNRIFFKSYFDILNCANLPNGENGFDCFGMNYYTLEQTKQIYKKNQRK